MVKVSGASFGGSAFIFVLIKLLKWMQWKQTIINEAKNSIYLTNSIEKYYANICHIKYVFQKFIV